jgi:molybdopterin-guanine dinucleotide biosynthesis protein A
MGRDKALIEVEGRALAVIAADALGAGGADDVVAVGGDAPALADLGLRWVPDRFPGEGPLGGLITALESLEADVVVVLSCDLPHVTGEAVASVVAALADDAADAAIPVVDGHQQTLLAAWRRATALGPLRDAFLTGERAIWRAASALEVTAVALRVATWACDADHADALFPRPGEG